MTDWPVITLKDAGVTLLDCVHKTPAATDTGLPYVTIPEMKGGRLDLESARRISESDFYKWTIKAFPQAHDVVLSRRCNPGETAGVKPGIRFALGQNLVLLRADSSRVHPPFLRWLVRGVNWWNQIQTFLNVGAVFDSLRCADVPNFQLPIPPLEVQSAIATVLDALDDKIELNSRMNRSLEEMAAAIFKAWFVDFDPVRAKADGATSFPGMTQDVFDTLPSTFADSELGPIPEGWKVKPIGEVVEVKGGGTPSTKNPDLWDGKHNWATPRDLSKLSDPILLDTNRRITDAGLSKVSSGLLPIGTVLLSSRAPIGYLAIGVVPTAINQGFIAMLPEGELSPPYLLNWAMVNMESIKGRANGTTFQEISKKHFNPMPVLVPDEDTLHVFSVVTRSLYDQIQLNMRESQSLAEIRDTLLPQLLSGSIRVKP